MYLSGKALHSVLQPIIPLPDVVGTFIPVLPSLTSIPYVISLMCVARSFHLSLPTQ